MVLVHKALPSCGILLWEKY